MNLSMLNPYVRSVGIRESVKRSDECRAYEARIFYMISGEANFSVNEKKIKLLGGNLLYIPAGTAYKIKAQRFLMAAIAFDLTAEYSCYPDVLPSTLEEFDESLLKKTLIPPFDKVIKIDDFDEERESIVEIAETAISCEGEWKAEISAKLKLLLVKIAAMADENALPPRMVRNLSSYIRENRRDEITNTEIGAIFGYHPFYVSNKLKSACGMTLRQYIISYRMKLAKSLLEFSEKSIAEIAEEAGFSDSSYFTKSFKSRFGMTPKEYRNKFKDNFF